MRLLGCTGYHSAGEPRNSRTRSDAKVQKAVPREPDQFFGRETHIHSNFEDPAAWRGSEEERLAPFPPSADAIRAYLREFPSRAAFDSVQLT